MHNMRAIILSLAAVFLCQVDAYAIQIRRASTDSTDSVIGQVTITNVDGADSSITLNGAHIRIVDKSTGQEYTDTIKENGTLVYQLPLGSYTLTQILAPNEYQLNTKAYEFTLQVPQGVDPSNIKAVNASVTMTNDLIGGSPGQEDNTADPPPVQPISGQADVSDGIPVEGLTASVDQGSAPGLVSAAEHDSIDELTDIAGKNPVTADNSNLLLAIIAFSVIILAGGMITRKYLFGRL